MREPAIVNSHLLNKKKSSEKKKITRKPLAKLTGNTNLVEQFLTTWAVDKAKYIYIQGKIKVKQMEKRMDTVSFKIQLILLSI